MTSVLRFTFFVVCVVCGTVFSLPCLTNKSKQDFNKARNALKSLENYLKSQANSIKYKVQALDKDMTSMEEDFKRRQWIKYNKHCYYIGDDSVRWTDAERKCREIGGYLVKIDDSSENNWIKQQINKSSRRTNFWLGSTDVVNGDWRWIYDQTQLSYKNFASSRPFPTSHSYSNSYNCIGTHYSNGKWYDLPCQNHYLYVCESNFCFQ
ncbi:perlucin-like protein [Mytilus californianus]|uniref:perlucin-like protein n=1 Tax=Mytilus californianus TaxID=6549 RepID=UPI0022464485|nr:perlucin-like protein [Mytilus californianus]